MFKSFRALAAAALVAVLPLTASAATVGYDAIDRSLADNFNDFAMVYTAETFNDGTITGWSAFIKRLGTDNTIGLMVLNDNGGNQYEVAAIELRTVTAGLNSFATSIAVTSGQVMGLFMANAKVAYDNVAPSDDRYTSNNLFAAGAPAVGAVFSTSGPLGRTYSLNATVAEVPVPASLPLVLAGMAAFGVASRRKRAA